MDVEFLMHRVEDARDSLAGRHGIRLGLRHVQVLYTALCACVLGAVRGGAGEAVRAAADPAGRGEVQAWSRHEQGAQLASFLLGYALALVPAAQLVRRVDGKLPLTGALLVCGAIHAAMPAIVMQGGVPGACGAQLALGASQSVAWPSLQALLRAWLPAHERTLLSRVVYSGVPCGVSLGLAAAGWLRGARLGWRLVHYSASGLALAMAALWVPLTAAVPAAQPALPNEERDYIRDALRHRCEKVPRVPWSRVLGSRAFWASSGAHAASNLVLVFYMVDVPVFLRGAGLSDKHSALWTALSLGAVVLSSWAARGVARGAWRVLLPGDPALYVDVPRCRSLANVLGGACVSLALALTPRVPAAAAPAALLAAAAVLGAQYACWVGSFLELSHDFPGALLLASRVVAGAAGALGPLATGLLVPEEEGADWRGVFAGLAALHMLGHATHALLGGGRQPWGRAGDGGGDHKLGHYNNSVDERQLELEELAGGTKLDPHPCDDTPL